MSQFRQFLLLLWKNYVLQKRNKVVTVAEFFVPALLAILLVCIRNIAPFNYHDNSTIYTPFDVNNLPSHIPNNQLFKQLSILFGKPGGQKALPIAYTPNISTIQSVVKNVANRLGYNGTGIGFKTENEMDHFIKYGTVDIFAGLVFTNLLENGSFPKKIEYKIRMKAKSTGNRNPLANVETWYTGQTYPSDQMNGPRMPYFNEGGIPGYYKEGFLAFQHTIDIAIMEKITGKNIHNVDMKMQRFPYPPYLEDIFQIALQQWLAFVFMVSYLYSGINLVKNLVHEKENKLKESMKMMGLSGWLHWIAWFLKAIIMLTFSSSFSVFLLSSNISGKLPVLEKSDPIVIMLFLTVYGIASISFSFFISVCFSKVREELAKPTVVKGTLLFNLHFCVEKDQALASIFRAAEDILRSPYSASIPDADSAIVESLIHPFLGHFWNHLSVIGSNFLLANSAATVAGLLWFVTFVPFLFIQPRYDSLHFREKILSCLISNTAMALGTKIIATFEGTGAGIQWENLANGINPEDNFSLMSVMIMLLLDAFIYWLLTWYIEAVFPGEFGIPSPWYFPFTKSYWCGTAEIEEVGHLLPESKRYIAPEYFEKDPVGMHTGIQIRNLSKVYRKKKIAVTCMNINMYEGQITVLLGHNGAGKTTTMSMLTGLIPPSQGTAIINGYDIRENIRAVRQSLGLCPQHDVLFDNLTVAEHLYFFSKLKGAPTDLVAPETKRILKILQLEDKTDAIVHTLSGGMKRKLSVAVALIGGSKVVMLDEPTSGMDPAARRATWDLLQQERAGRTILLTTHFMDEADLLGDRIAIMANGELQCCGTPLFLKKKYGAGYHMITVKKPNCDTKKVTKLIQDYLPSAEMESNIGAELSYILPHEGVSKFEELFTILERDKEALGISSFGASITTMEEVFLRVGETNASEGLKSQFQQTKFSQDNKQFGGFNLNKVEFTSSASNVIMEGSMDPLMTNSLRRNQGLSLYFQQFKAMLIKRMLYSRRNWILSLTQLAIPVTFIITALTVVKTLPTNEHPRSMVFSLLPFGESKIPYIILNGNNSNKNVQSLAKFYDEQFSGNFHPVNVNTLGNHYNNLTSYLLGESSHDLSHFNRYYIIGASFGYNAIKNQFELIAHFNNQPYHGPAITLSYIDSALLKYFTNDTEYSFSVVNHPFPPSIADVIYRGFSSNVGFAVAFNLVFGVAILGSSFVFFLIKERTIKARHLQFVSGVHFTIFWSATFLWDFLNYMLPCLGILLVFVIFNEEGFIEPDMQMRFIFVFMVYGWSLLPLMYILSFLFKESSTGFTRLTLFNILSGVATLLTVTIMLIPELHLVKYGQLLDWFFLVLPNYCLGWSFTDLYKNHEVLKLCSYPMVRPFCDLTKYTKSCGNYPCPEFQDNYLAWEHPGIGRMITFLIGEGFLFIFILVIIEVPVVRKFGQNIYHFICHCCKHRSQKVYIKLSQDPVANTSDQEELGILEDGREINEDDQQQLVEDDDVANERERIENNTLGRLCTTDNLILRDVTKYYGDFLAVDHISVGIPRGECFGLLGINGAGKTTTFKMMTGDESLSEGDAFVEGFSVNEHIKQVQQRIGYCPQFDALIDQMTGRETLVMYARLRGVPEDQIPSVLMKLAENLLLSEHLDILVKDYSGGNKRKLSTAVALIGSPPIIFLDEPTTGMDPLARRLLWDAISRVRDSGHSIVLTSHSMEECDVLCTRLAIMVNGQFRCLGSPQHLKNKFGQGYTLIAKVHTQSDGRTIDSVVQRLRNFIEANFKGSVLKDLHHSMIHYHIQNPKLSWSYIFGTMERAKSEYCIEDYSVSQTTLEQVFLNFARNQRSTDVS